MEALEKNQALRLVEFPYGRTHDGPKWVFKMKSNAKRKDEVQNFDW